MPEPQKGESLKSFIGKYMGSEHARKKFTNPKQRYAVARSEFKRKKKH